MLEKPVVAQVLIFTYMSDLPATLVFLYLPDQELINYHTNEASWSQAPVLDSSYLTEFKSESYMDLIWAHDNFRNTFTSLLQDADARVLRKLKSALSTLYLRA
jgi:hypothetical protein